jgi:hypothetical protein
MLRRLKMVVSHNGWGLGIVIAAAVIVIAAGAGSGALEPVSLSAVVVLALLAGWGLLRLFSRGPIPWVDGAGTGRILGSAAAGALVVLALIQAVPYGRAHENPPVTAEPAWDSARTRELAQRACFDCHSNETRWPWYSNVAPVSWSVTMHVDEGRDRLNFSEWDRPRREAGEAAETVQEGSMPPLYYRMAHPDARLSAGEKAELSAGLRASLGG